SRHRHELSKSPALALTCAQVAGKDILLLRVELLWASGTATQEPIHALPSAHSPPGRPEGRGTSGHVTAPHPRGCSRAPHPRGCSVKRATISVTGMAAAD